MTTVTEGLIVALARDCGLVVDPAAVRADLAARVAVLESLWAVDVEGAPAPAPDADGEAELRADVATACLPRDVVLAAAAGSRDGKFAVRRGGEGT